MIYGLAVGDQVITEHADMAQATFEHYDALLGTDVGRECSFDLAQFTEPCDLGELDTSFSEEEIWCAAKRLPTHKAPGPDGFMAEFLRACWGKIRKDIVDAFQQLYEMRGQGFARLNQALLILLPKRTDASQLG